MHFKNRVEAGQLLTHALAGFEDRDIIVYGLPRGGVVPAAEIAKKLGAPLDLCIARKISHPLSPEYAIGAVTETGRPLWNKDEVGAVSLVWKRQQVEAARDEARRQRLSYQGDRAHVDPAGKTAVLVDDGVATGLTMQAAIQELRRLGPKAILLAVPIVTQDIFTKLGLSADGIVALHVPEFFSGSVGSYYEEFDPVEDEEVRLLLDSYRSLPDAKPLDLESLNALLATVRRFPISSQELASTAKRLHAPNNVVQFFEAIPTGTSFSSKADIMQRSQQAEVLMEEEANEPPEQLRSYD